MYPSPQQFYNALVRKGWETPEESIPTMVAIHNWMNEAAWSEVVRWESRYFGPPSVGPTASADEVPDLSLTRFTGRPKELSPKARFHGLLAKLFPATYSAEPPFDRHDWMIRRDGWGESERDKTHRYVIDYYSAPDDENGNPVFHLGALTLALILRLLTAWSWQTSARRLTTSHRCEHVSPNGAGSNAKPGSARASRLRQARIASKRSVSGTRAASAAVIIHGRSVGYRIAITLHRGAPGSG